MATSIKMELIPNPSRWLSIWISPRFFIQVWITVFPQIDPAGTILFLRSEVRVLIKGGLYSRAGSILDLVKMYLKLGRKWLKTANFRVKMAIFTFFHNCGYNSRAGTIFLSNWKVRVVFKGGYNSRAGTIWGITVFLYQDSCSNCQNDRPSKTSPP